MSDLYTFRSALVNLATAYTNPATMRRRARRNTDAALRHEPDFLHLSEAWQTLTRRGIYDALPANYGLIKRPRNSAVLAYNRKRFDLIHTWQFQLHGRVAGTYGIVSDARWAVGATFAVRGGVHRLNVGALHLAPAGTRKGQRAMEASRRAHATATRNIAAFADDHPGVPLILAGDFNTRARFLAGGQSVGQGISHGIDRLEARDGINVAIRGLHADVGTLPSSDHELIVVTGRGVTR